MENKIKPQPVLIVVGGNYGSEAKGCVAASLCTERKVDYVVRTGAVNAGHSVMYNGKKYKMQLLPTGWTNPNCKLVIGAGAYVHPEILEKEVAMIKEATGEDIRKRLYIDVRAGIHTELHHKKETGMHERMGSTGEGCMAAAVDKMERRFDYKLFSQTSHAAGYMLVDTIEILNSAYGNGQQILLEGTQGAHLDLHVGRYPFVTSRQTNAANWVNEAGLSPSMEFEVVLVMRTYPIRVAGNSGAMPNETSWEKIALEINKKLEEAGRSPLVSHDAIEKYKEKLTYVCEQMELPTDQLHELNPKQREQYAVELTKVHKTALDSLAPETVEELEKLFEMTTVTKKLRRVARFDADDAKRAIMFNRPAYIVLTFANYDFPSMAGIATPEELIDHERWTIFKEYLVAMENSIGDIPIKYVNFEPGSIVKIKD